MTHYHFDGIKRPPTIIPMKAHGMPRSWRPIMEEEMTRDQVSIKDVLTGKYVRHLFRLRQRIWKRLEAERGATPSDIARAFECHHTTVSYALGRLNRK